MKTRVFYPGTFDPLTLGHVDIVRRTERIFEHIIVAVAESPNKNTLFTLAERVAMTKQVFDDYNIKAEVIGFDNLLINCMREHNANVLVRGLRAVSDFEYEFQLASMNRHLDANIETIFFTPGDDYTFISSSMVKEVAKLGGDVSEFVPESIYPTLIDQLRKKR